MEEEKEAGKINKILSTIYIGFNCIFFLFIIKSYIKSSKKSTKSLKIKFCILVIIDIIIYIFYLFDLNTFGYLYYELLFVAINSLQIYLFISIYKKMIILIKIKKLKELDRSLKSYQISLISFLIIFPFHKLFNFETKIIISVQNVLIIIVVYVFYKQLVHPLNIILKKLNKKNTSKLLIIKSLKFLLDLSFYFIFVKIIINILLIIFVNKNYQDFLNMPLNLIIYLKYFAYTLLYLTIGQLEEVLMKKNRFDDADSKLRVKNEANSIIEFRANKK